MKETITLLLADDHKMVREGIRAFLTTQPHLQIVGEAADGHHALELCQELKPDVVLMDISMPGLTGIEATRRLRRLAPRTRVIALTFHNKREYARQIIQSGASGYVLKDASPEELVHAIETVHAGEPYFTPAVNEFIVKDYIEFTDTQSRRRSLLSDRETEILILVAQGCSSKDIAGQLGISLRTVETHREHINQKLDIHSVAGLTHYAISHGLVLIDSN